MFSPLQIAGSIGCLLFLILSISYIQLRNQLADDQITYKRHVERMEGDVSTLQRLKDRIQQDFEQENKNKEICLSHLQEAQEKHKECFYSYTRLNDEIGSKDDFALKQQDEIDVMLGEIERLKDLCSQKADVSENMEVVLEEKYHLEDTVNELEELVSVQEKRVEDLEKLLSVGSDSLNKELFDVMDENYLLKMQLEEMKKKYGDAVALLTNNFKQESEEEALGETAEGKNESHDVEKHEFDVESIQEASDHLANIENANEREELAVKPENSLERPNENENNGIFEQLLEPDHIENIGKEPSDEIEGFLQPDHPENLQAKEPAAEFDKLMEHDNFENIGGENDHENKIDDSRNFFLPNFNQVDGVDHIPQIKVDDELGDVNPSLFENIRDENVPGFDNENMIQRKVLGIDNSENAVEGSDAQSKNQYMRAQNLLSPDQHLYGSKDGYFQMNNKDILKDNPLMPGDNLNSRTNSLFDLLRRKVSFDKIQGGIENELSNEENNLIAPSLLENAGMETEPIQNINLADANLIEQNHQENIDKNIITGLEDQNLFSPEKNANVEDGVAADDRDENIEENFGEFNSRIFDDSNFREPEPIENNIEKSVAEIGDENMAEVFGDVADPFENINFEDSN